MMKPITALSDIKGKKILIRVGYDVPLKGNTIVDARRIESSYKTIDYILKKGGIPILLTHQGEEGESVKPIARYLSKKYKVLFIGGDFSEKTAQEVIQTAQQHTVVLLENLRKNKGEKKNDPAFAKALARLGDAYINDAFPVSHRAHASIVGVPKLLPSYAGFQLLAEIDALSEVVKAKTHPFLFILGGAKFSTKIPLLTRFLKAADGVVITGAILNNFYKVAGFEVGKSVVEKGYDKEIKPMLKHSKLLLPTDVIVKRSAKSLAVSADEVEKTDAIFDIGPRSIEAIGAKIKKAKLVVWNGPTGWYEGGYDKGTVALARAIARSRTKAVIGGGDTAAVIEKSLGASVPKRIFISTGGGATLDFLAKGTLPGIEALT